ncbi:hypothetical protein EGM51_16655 [Verrucomicrobia bacterium S94]|nr:hypothetical protein EGM51_16655 [Verrucomicrobia bacterium S94]
MSLRLMVTVCAHREFIEWAGDSPFFLPNVRKMLEEEWRRGGEVRTGVYPGPFVDMPDHVHGLLRIEPGASELGRVVGGRPFFHIRPAVLVYSFALSERRLMNEGKNNSRVGRPLRPEKTAEADKIMRLCCPDCGGRESVVLPAGAEGTAVLLETLRRACPDCGGGKRRLERIRHISKKERN